MKTMIQIICCAAGSGLIGFFANRLNTGVGSLCFTIGIVLLVNSIILISKQEKENK